MSVDLLSCDGLFLDTRFRPELGSKLGTRTTWTPCSRIFAADVTFTSPVAVRILQGWCRMRARWSRSRAATASIADSISGANLERRSGCRRLKDQVDIGRRFRGNVAVKQLCAVGIPERREAWASRREVLRQRGRALRAGRERVPSSRVPARPVRDSRASAVLDEFVEIPVGCSEVNVALRSFSAGSSTATPAARSSTIASSRSSTRNPIERSVSPMPRGSATAKCDPSGSAYRSASTPPICVRRRPRMS